MKDILTNRLSKIGFNKEEISAELNREKDVRDFKVNLSESSIRGELKLGLMLSMPYTINSKVISSSIIERINSNKISTLISSHMGITSLFIGNVSEYITEQSEENTLTSKKRFVSSYISSDLRKIIGKDDTRGLNRKDLEDAYARKFLGTEYSSSNYSEFRVKSGNIYLSTRSEILSEIFSIIHEYSTIGDLKAVSISVGSPQDIFIYI